MRRRTLLQLCVWFGVISCVVGTEDYPVKGQTQLEFLGLFQKTAAVLHCVRLPCQSVSVEYWWIFQNSNQSRVYSGSFSTKRHVDLLDLSGSWSSDVFRICFRLQGTAHKCYSAQNASTGIPRPQQVTAVSSNVNHTVFWGSPQALDDHYFEVEIMDLTFDWRIWEPVGGCHPTKRSSCRVYEPIHDRYDKECPDYTNMGKFNFRVRDCLTYHKKMCSDWVETVSPLRLPGLLLPPSFDVIGVFSETQLRILNKPYLVAPSNKSLDCYYDEKLMYMIEYWSPNDTSQPTRERRASFNRTLITLKLFGKPKQNAYMCVKMRLFDDASYKSDWRSVCKTVQMPEGLGDNRPKFIIILGVTLTIGVLLLGVTVYKLKMAYERFFKRDMKLPDKLVEILRDLEKAFEDTSMTGTSRFDEFHSDEPEYVDAFSPLCAHASPSFVPADYEDDGDSVFAIASLFSDGRESPSIPIVVNADTSSENDFMYIRNAASANISHYPGPQNTPPEDNTPVHTCKVDVHGSSGSQCSTSSLKNSNTEPCCGTNTRHNFQSFEYTTVEQELSRSLQMRPCRNGVLETCLEDKVSNLRTTPGSSMDDVFLDDPGTVAIQNTVGRIRTRQYEMENPTYITEVQSPHDAIGFNRKFEFPINRSSSVESADNHVSEPGQQSCESSRVISLRKNRARPKRSSLYQRRINRRKRMHSFGYLSIFGVHDEHGQLSTHGPSLVDESDAEVHVCHGRSQCCPRCCTRTEQVRSRSDSCRSADSGYPLDWSSFSDESPPSSPMELFGFGHNSRVWLSHRWHKSTVTPNKAKCSHPIEEPQLVHEVPTATTHGIQTESPKSKHDVQVLPTCDKTREAESELPPSDENAFFRPGFMRDYASSNYLEFTALQKMFPKINTNV